VTVSALVPDEIHRHSMRIVDIGSLFWRHTRTESNNMKRQTLGSEQPSCLIGFTDIVCESVVPDLCSSQMENVLVERRETQRTKNSLSFRSKQQ
jgi:hypothetical protein